VCYGAGRSWIPRSTAPRRLRSCSAPQ
jgi:hypothetical protein